MSYSAKTQGADPLSSKTSTGGFPGIPEGPVESKCNVQVIVLASSLAVIGFLILLRAHKEPAARLLLPWLAIAWVALLALGLLLQALLPLPHAAPDERAFLYPDAGWAYEQDQADEAR